MKDIGEQLKQSRINMGISLEEVAEDLKLKPSQIENIENGDKLSFKDVFSLKQAIHDYAKYLGLEHDDIEDEFNEFVFEYTSKIPLDEIAKASIEKNKEKEQAKEIVSPYTADTIPKKHYFRWFLIIASILFLLFGGYFLIKNIQANSDVKPDVAFFFFHREG